MLGNNGGGRFAFTYTVRLSQKLENVISLFAGVQEKNNKVKKIATDFGKKIAIRRSHFI